jgi:hypothetical protein
MLTFEQFQATRIWCDDLGKTTLSDASLEGVPGFLYVDSLYIDAPAGGSMPDLYHLHIGCDEWTSGNLEELERTLYQFGVDEGHCDAEAR